MKQRYAARDGSRLSRTSRGSRYPFLSTCLAAALAAAVAGPGSMAAEPGNELPPPASGENIFTTPRSGAVATPHFNEGSRTRRRGARSQGGEIPGWRQVREIPTLTPEQRRQIKSIFEGSRERLRPQLEELKAMRAQSRGGQPPAGAASEGAGGSGVGPGGSRLGASGRGLGPGRGRFGAGAQRMDPEMRQRMIQLRDELKRSRQDSWQQVQAVLTREQREQFEAMRKGELMMPGIQKP